MSVAKLVLLTGAVLVAAPVAQAQAPGPLDRLLGGPGAPAAPPPAAPQAQPGPTLPTLAPPPAAQAPQPTPLAPPPAAPAPQPAPLAPPPAAQAPGMPAMGAGRSPAAGPNVQFQAPPPASVALERPATPPVSELDAMMRLQTDIARLRLELEKARLEREISQQRQLAPSRQPDGGPQATPVRPAATQLPPPPAAIPRPDPAAADRRALPQVIEIRGAAGNFVAVVQTAGGQRLTLRPGDNLPNTPLKVQSIEPRLVNFAAQEGNRGPYPVPVSPAGAAAAVPAAQAGPVVRPLTDMGIATPVAR